MKNNITFLFPGQGSQAVGMGKSFYDAYPDAYELFQEADEILGKHLSRLIFEGPEESLKETINSQPAIFVTSIAILRVLQKQFPNLCPHLCAGHSLGEYSAICAAKWLNFKECLELVQFRASSMSLACKKRPGAMAAILGLDESSITQLIRQVGKDVWAANFNCPGQIVISGTKEAIEQAMVIAKERGAKRALPLAVEGAFHSGLMQSAQEVVEQKIEALSFVDGGVPIISNTTAKKAVTAAEIKRALANQITQSVLWSQSMQLASEQTSLFIEIGQGKVLSGLNRKICEQIPTLSISNPSDLEQLSQELV